MTFSDTMLDYFARGVTLAPRVADSVRKVQGRQARDFPSREDHRSLTLPVRHLADFSLIKNVMFSKKRYQLVVDGGDLQRDRRN
jgi:hypothetical protein